MKEDDNTLMKQEDEMKEQNAPFDNQRNKSHASRTDRWHEKLQELRDFKNREGHCRVPSKFNGNPSLGKWVSTQREEYKRLKEGKKSLLDKNRFEALENIGFTWSINKITSHSHMAWMDKYDQLKEFHAREGHCRVPQKYPENRSLGRWVMSQRLQYKRMQQGNATMPRERLKALQDIGFTWEVVGPKGESWMNQYNALNEFKKRHGHCRVPRTYFGDAALTNWVNFQRKQYSYMKQGKRSLITKERVNLLNDIGFIWYVYGEDSDMWMKNYQELKQFKDQEGHCLVPVKFERNLTLGGWVATQRQQYKYMKQGKSSIMTEQRAQLLNEIGFVWNANK